MRKFLATALVCAALAVLPAAAFSDVTDSDAALAAETLQSLDIIGGFEDGSYRPGSPLTRAQFSKIAVIALGDESQVVLQKSFTVFPDVRASHWAAGYVNVAVRHSKIFNGYPDGTFMPDKPITEAEAVTICLRMLGYDVEDVGLFWPADYIGKAAELGLTDGLVITAGSPMTRGRAAILVANMLAMDEKEGSVFAARIGATAEENVTLLAAPATDLSMAAGTLRVSVGGAESTLYSNKDVPGVQVGRRGVLLKGKDGKVAGFVPYRYEDIAVTVKSTDKDGISVLGGGRYLIPITTEVVVGGSLEKYETAWSDLRSGTSVLLHYNPDGVLEYISMGYAVTGGSVHVLKNDYGASRNPLLDFYSDDIVKNAAIVKNGAAVTASALRKNDTVSYNADTRILTVSDMKLTGGLEAVYPTKTSAQQVTVYGHNFRLAEGYTPDLSGYADGENATLLLTADGRVAEIRKFTELSATAYGQLSAGSAGSATVVLTNGITLTAKPTNDCTDIEGYFVSVTAGGGGKMTVKA
ncbi:MAG TPA: S-layer homology domain-containing protein, partial [Terriglobales bacterium]|nr:S-layer homology domain-containing protein [Terriglobales bacterium]